LFRRINLLFPAQNSAVPPNKFHCSAKHPVYGTPLKLLRYSSFGVTKTA
jgi:hypothetical protein